jgi:hypothetical protein
MIYHKCSMTISYGLDEWVWTSGRRTNTSLHHLLPIDTGAHWISYTISTRVLSARIMRLELEAYPHFRLALGQGFSVRCWTKNVICTGRPTTYIFKHKKKIESLVIAHSQFGTRRRWVVSINLRSLTPYKELVSWPRGQPVEHGKSLLHPEPVML